MSSGSDNQNVKEFTQGEADGGRSISNYSDNPNVNAFTQEEANNKVPRGASMNAQNQTITHKVEGKVTLYDPSGKQIAEPVLMSSFGAPTAAGIP